MTKDVRIVTSDAKGNLFGEEGQRLTTPHGWIFLPAGDAGVTRKVTANGEFWRVQVKRGRRIISKGIWAPEATVVLAQQEVDKTRTTDEYKKKREYSALRRDSKQATYEGEFVEAVATFLNFHTVHKASEQAIAIAVTKHAIPIGSGTVARTVLIPIEERASRAVIAWMRHKTTAYDTLNIAKIKGERRAIRRLLAEQSVSVLTKYRTNIAIPSSCPLLMALRKIGVQ